MPQMSEAEVLAEFAALNGVGVPVEWMPGWGSCDYDRLPGYEVDEVEFGTWVADCLDAETVAVVEDRWLALDSVSADGVV